MKCVLFVDQRSTQKPNVPNSPELALCCFSYTKAHKQINLLTVTPLLMSVGGIFASKMNQFVRLMVERLGENIGMDSERMLSCIRTGISMRILRAYIACV